MEEKDVINRKFDRRGFIGGVIVGGTAFSLSSILGTVLPAYASGAVSTADG